MLAPSAAAAPGRALCTSDDGRSDSSISFEWGNSFCDDTLVTYAKTSKTTIESKANSK
jgi:hypothetical protein